MEKPKKVWTPFGLSSEDDLPKKEPSDKPFYPVYTHDAKGINTKIIYIFKPKVK